MNPTIALIISTSIFFVVLLVIYVIMRQKARDKFREGYWKGSQFELNPKGETFYRCLGVSDERHKELNAQSRDYLKKALTTQIGLGGVYAEINHLPIPFKEKLVIICEFQFKMAVFMTSINDLRRIKEGMIEMVGEADTAVGRQMLNKVMTSELASIISTVMSENLDGLKDNNVRVNIINPQEISKETLEDFGIVMPDSKKKTGEEDAPVKSPDDQDEDSSLSQM